MPLFEELHVIFLINFLGWVIFPALQAASADHGEPRASDLSIKSGDVTIHHRSPENDYFF